MPDQPIPDKRYIIKTSTDEQEFTKMITEATDIGYHLLFAGRDKGVWWGIFKLGAQV